MADTFEKKLGKRIRAARERAGLSQANMQAHGFSLSHYQKIERGVLDPRLSTVMTLARVFGVTLDELTSGLTPPKKT